MLVAGAAEGDNGANFKVKFKINMGNNSSSSSGPKVKPINDLFWHHYYINLVVGIKLCS
jgi:hypothetical protein